MVQGIGAFHVRSNDNYAFKKEDSNTFTKGEGKDPVGI